MGSVGSVMIKRSSWLFTCLYLGLGTLAANAAPVFERQNDIGSVSPPGIGKYDPTGDSYTVTSSGANIWARQDAFHFLWKKMSGDAVLTADIAFAPPAAGRVPSPYRKAVLMMRRCMVRA